MIIVLGLIILVAALIVAVAGVLGTAAAPTRSAISQCSATT